MFRFCSTHIVILAACDLAGIREPDHSPLGDDKDITKLLPSSFSLQLFDDAPQTGTSSKDPSLPVRLIRSSVAMRPEMYLRSWTALDRPNVISTTSFSELSLIIKQDSTKPLDFTMSNHAAY